MAKEKPRGMKIQVYCPEQKAFITPLEIGICPYYQAEPLDFRSTEGVIQQLFRCHVQCGCQIQYRYYDGEKLVTRALDIVGDEARLRSIVEGVVGAGGGAAPMPDAGRQAGSGAVLLVDDDVDFVEINSAVLEQAGYRVVKAYSAKECLKKLPEVRPSVVILDVMMEQFDSGFQIANRIKEMTGGVPVILLTSIGAETGLPFRPGDAEGLRKMGADAFLDKPVKPETLLAKVRELVGKRA
jgi:CheY-like chemotaxis protein